MIIDNLRKYTTQFGVKWGINAADLALVENTTETAIHMRVKNYGTPFQRRAKITLWEKKYGKTLGAIAEELNIHPLTVKNRESKYDDVYCDTFKDERGGWNKSNSDSWKRSADYKKLFVTTYFTLEDALKRLEDLNNK
jgi:hypothetical protein